MPEVAEAGTRAWQPRAERGLKLKLVALIREDATDSFREEEFRSKLKVDRWWAGVWEGRWRA